MRSSALQVPPQRAQLLAVCGEPLALELPPELLALPPRLPGSDADCTHGTRIVHDPGPRL